MTHLNKSDVELIAARVDPEYPSSLVGHELGAQLLAKAAIGEHSELINAVISVAMMPVEGDLAGHHGSVLDLRVVDEVLLEHEISITSHITEDMVDELFARLLSLGGHEMAFMVIVPSVDSVDLSDRPESLEKTLVFLIRRILIHLVRKGSDRALATSVELLASKSLIARRLALSVINATWPTLEDSFWRFFVPSHLLDVSVRPELRPLFSSHYADMSDDHKGEVIEHIRDMTLEPQTSTDDSEADGERILYEKARWSSTISDSGFSPADVLHQEILSELGGREPRFIDSPYTFRITGGWKPSVAYQEVLSGSPDAVAERLTEDQSSNIFESEELTSALQEAVANAPDLYASGLESFNAVSQKYQAAIFSGLAGAVRDGELVAHSFVFSWLTTLLDTIDLTDENDQMPRQLLGRGLDYLQAVLDQPDQLMSEEIRASLGTLLLRVLAVTRPEVSTFEDPVLAALNDPRGQAMTAVIRYAYGEAVFEQRKFGQANWPPKILETVEYETSQSDGEDVAMWASIGRNLSLIYRLDPAWFADAFSKWGAFEVDANFRAFSLGHLSASEFIDELYALLRDQGVFHRMLEGGTTEGARDRLPGLIGLAYLRGLDELDGPGGPLTQLISMEDSSGRVSELIRHVWSDRGSMNPEAKTRGIALWHQLLEQFEPFEDAEARQVASDLNLFISLLDSLGTEDLERLGKTLQYTDLNQNSWSVIEELARLSDSSPSEAGNLFFDLANLVGPYTYPLDAIRSIVRNAFESGHQDIGNSVCNLYGRAGLDSLSDIQSEYS